MALRAVYDSPMTIAAWFDPLTKVEGWMDQELTASVAPPPPPGGASLCMLMGLGSLFLVAVLG